MEKRQYFFRVFLILVAMCVFFIEVSWPCYAESYDKSLLRTVTGGKIQGKLDRLNNQVFKGIPYAAAPTGNNRWRAPQAVVPWSGTRDVIQFGNACVQVGNPTGHYDPETFGSVIGDEDCLYLNLWRPNTSHKNLPVMVWVHGGANLYGTTADPLYSGARLASFGGVIFISVSYRLANLGWFTHPALRADANDKDASGNFATLDLIKALEWIQDNVSEFGGNPDNITIAGQSAGCINIWGLLLSDLSENVFHRAVCASGYAAVNDVADGEEQSQALLTSLLVKDGYADNVSGAIQFADQQSDAWVAKYLRGQTASDIVSHAPGPVKTHFKDGEVIPSLAYARLLLGGFNKVPLIIGTTKDESTLFLAKSDFFDVTISELWELINDSDDSDTTDVADVLNSNLYLSYKPVHEALSYKLNLLIDKLTKVLRFHYGVGSSNLFRYNFEWQSFSAPWKEIFATMHGLDIPFLLGNFPTHTKHLINFAWEEKNLNERNQLSELMMNYLVRFMRTGDPNAKDDDLIIWEDWSNFSGNNKRMIFDSNSGMSAFNYTTSDYENLFNSLTEKEQAIVDEYLKD